MNEFLNFMISREHLWVPLCHIWMRYFAVWSFLVWFIFHWCVSSAWVISHSWVLSVKQFSCILFVPLKLLCLLPVKEQYLHSFHFFFQCGSSLLICHGCLLWWLHHSSIPVYRLLFGPCKAERNNQFSKKLDIVNSAHPPGLSVPGTVITTCLHLKHSHLPHHQGWHSRICQLAKKFWMWTQISIHNHKNNCHFLSVD